MGEGGGHTETFLKALRGGAAHSFPLYVSVPTPPPSRPPVQAATATPTSRILPNAVSFRLPPPRNWGTGPGAPRGSHRAGYFQKSPLGAPDRSRP